MSFHNSPNQHARADDHDIPTRSLTEDDLHEAAALADGLTVVPAPRATEEFATGQGASAVVTLDAGEFPRIQAEHDAALSFKLLCGGSGI